MYVVPYPGPGGKWQVSTGGGAFPCWSADGRTIYYHALDHMIMAVPVTVGASLELGTPAALFRDDIDENTSHMRRWMPAADDRRFLVLQRPAAPTDARFVVVTDWTAQLEHR